MTAMAPLRGHLVAIDRRSVAAQPMERAARRDLPGQMCLDALACFAASGVGFWLDGSRALLLMQAMCGRLPLVDLVEYHLLVLPATTVAMLGAALVCCRRAPGTGGLRRLGRWPFEVAATYAAMMALMAAGAAAAANTIGAQTHAALGGAILSNVLFLAALRVFRLLPGTAKRAAIALRRRRARPAPAGPETDIDTFCLKWHRYIRAGQPRPWWWRGHFWPPLEGAGDVCRNGEQGRHALGRTNLRA